MMKKLLTPLFVLLIAVAVAQPCNPPSIFTQPTSYSGVCSGVNFFCFANGDNLTYQWQINTLSGFVDLTDGGPYSLTNNPVIDINTPPYSLNGSQYRCIVSGSCGPNDTSAIVTMGVEPRAIINTQPVPQTTCDGASATFSLRATNVVNYNWEVASSPSGPWTSLADGGVYSGVYTNTLDITGATLSQNGEYYRCLLMDNCYTGDYYSDTVLLTVNTCNPLNTWLGNTTQWTLGSNWSTGTAPNSCAIDVLIPASPVGGNFPQIAAGSPSVGNLRMESGATISINVGLNVCGNISGGTTTAARFLGNGSVLLQGSSQQFIGRKIAFRKLRLNNAAGADLQSGAVVSVDSFVLLQSGVLTTGAGSFTLNANANGTAYLNNFSPNTYTGSVNGPVTMQLPVNNIADGYRDISAPVSTTVADLANDFAVFGQNGVQCWYSYSPYPNVQVYDEALSIVDGNFFEGWLSYTGGSNVLNPLQGVAVRTYKGAPFNINFTGQPNNGPQSIAITNTPSSTPAQDGWNLVGNPYPSAIKWSAVKAMNAGKTDGSYYVFHTSGEYTGNWGTHNGVTGVNGATDDIAVAQGFFVSATGNHVLTMDNSVRSTAVAAFYKTDMLQDELRLVISDGNNSDEIVSYTDATASVNYDAALDAVKMPAGSTVSISYNLLSKEYAINVVDAINAQTELPLIVTARDNGTYTISAPVINLNGFTAYLKDAQTNALYDLTTSSPALSLTGGQVYSNRFSIVFKQAEVLSVNDMATNPTRIYASGNAIFVNQSAIHPAQITVANVLGQTIANANTTGLKTELQLNGVTGYVFVRVTEGEQVTTAKVLISNN